MSQTKVDFSQNPTGPQLMDDYLAKMQENVLTTNSGVTRPEYAKQGTLWIDMSTTPWLLKVYDGSQDIILGKIDINNDKFISSNPMTTTGDITVQGADGNPARLAPGTEGYVLMSNGAGKLPSYRDVGSEYARADSVVDLTSNQTIGGGKTFTDEVILEQGQNDKLFFKDTRVDVSSETGTDTFNTIIFRDKNNFNYANIAVQDEADGGKRLRLLVQNKLTNGTTKSEQIWIDVEKNGNVVTYAPTPATNSNTTNIATTAWFRNNMQVVTSLPSSPTAGVFYFIKE